MRTVSLSSLYLGGDAQALKNAGVPHELRVAKDMIHAFMQFDMLEECRQTLAAIFAFLKERL